MHKHSVRIDFDEDTGELTVTHRVVVEVAGHKVAYAQPVELVDKDDVVKNLKSLIDANRDAMNEGGQVAAVQHVAAVTGKGVGKAVRLTGTVGATGTTNVKG